jgi:ferrous iron transport protein A
MKDLPADSLSAVPLGNLHRGATGTVAEVVDRNESLGDEAQSTLARRLLEIGFVRGERCEVIGETWPGGDPMAVRIGNSTFALRRREANAVLVHVDHQP